MSREQFEKLPEISEILEEDKVYLDGDIYSLPFNSLAESFINGAWYAYQEQQKKIDEKQKLIHDILLKLHVAYLSGENSSIEIVYGEIKELLK